MNAPWTNVYGVARSIIALSTLSSLALHPAVYLFRPFGLTLLEATPTAAGRLSLFHVIPSLEWARLLAIVVLLLVVSGWRPRLTGIAHWYVTFSFAASSFVLEGGDQICALMALLLIPVTLTDTRRWHWSRSETEASHSMWLRETVYSFFIIARLQVCVIYLHASIGKMSAPEWLNGTAIYYWAQHPIFGAGPWLHALLMPLLVRAVPVAVITWGVMALELLLAAGLVMDRRHRRLLLIAGLFFHFGIILLHGLASFFFAMAGSLILYLRPLDEEFGLPEWDRWFARGRAFADSARTMRFRPWRRLTGVGGETSNA